MESKRRLSESGERANPVTLVHAWRTPAGADSAITLLTHLDLYAEIHEHASEALPNETGGFLLGRVALDAAHSAWHIEIDEMLPVQPVEQNPVHFSFTWRDVNRARTRREAAGKALVGWYHTHPGLGVFLSETDLEKTHRVLFNEPFQVALVYDPVRRRGGYFFWEAAQMIDASQAAWREFEIALAPETPPPDGGSPLADEDTASVPAAIEPAKG
jgi:26S proteasome regulatory subunit N11